jgi:CubicO group peptidase (beta-lactamase class C family)
MKSGIRFLAAGFLLAVCVSFHGSLWADEPNDAPETIAELRAAIQAILEENRIPGASIALVDRDRVIWAGGVGKADLAADRDATADTLFRVGSISKSFNALAVMTAVEAGLLDLDTPIREAAPDVAFENPWQDTRPITLAMALEHTTGFDDIRVREYAKVDDPGMTLVDGLAFNPSSRVSRWKPGTHMSYCNAGPPIAARALEIASGQDFESYVRANVLEPLGMHQSSFHFPENAARMAKGYRDDGVTEAHYDHITIRPSGALNSSASEMANYLRLMLNRGELDGRRLLRPESIERMETPTTTLAARAGHTYGYGLGNYTTIVNGHLFHGHDGGITGFAATSAYSSELGVGFYISVNRPSGAIREIREHVGKFLTRDFEALEPPRADLTEEQLRTVAGYYQLVTPRSELTRFMLRLLDTRRVSLEAGSLFVKPLIGGERRELIPVTVDSFRLEGRPVATQFLVTDEAGDSILQGRFGGNARQVPGWWIYGQLAVAAAVLTLMVSSLLFAFIWLPARVFGRFSELPVQATLVSLLAVLSLLGGVLLPFVLNPDMITDFGNRTARSMTVFLGTIAFAALSFYGLIAAWRSWTSDGPRAARLHALLVAAACVIAVLYLGGHGLIGLRTWAY